MADIEVNLITLLGNAGKPELNAINARITQLGSEIREYVDSRKAEMASLKIVRRAISRKLQTPAAREKKPKANREMTELQKMVFDLLTREGSMPLPVIAARTKRTAQGIAAMIGTCDWFTRLNGEVHIART